MAAPLLRTTTLKIGFTMTVSRCREWIAFICAMAAREGGPGDPRFYQTSLDLDALLGSENKPLVSITFEKAAANATAIYAISGEAAAELPATIVTQPLDVTVSELASVAFLAKVAGVPVPGLQWFRNGIAVPGANSSTYSIPSVALVEDRAAFQLVATNFANGAAHSVSSSVATLRVLADTTAPVLVGAQALGLTQVQASFSERIQSASATNLTHYSITNASGNLTISNALLDPSQSNIVLTVATMLDGDSYTLTVNDLVDQSAAGNVIAPDSQTRFVATANALSAIGDPVLPGRQVPAGNGYDITAGGSNLGGRKDQLEFSYQKRSGDFDFKVRLDALGLADAWSVAGLVAREDLTPGTVSAGALATPNISGAFFESRNVANGAAILAGSFPVNYPDTWLRLKRAGNAFTGFGSFDGEHWTQLGAADLGMPASIYIGFAVSSHNPNQTVTASFRDFSNVTNPKTGGLPQRETLRQSSRRTSLAISEIMYHPINTRGSINTNNFGFVTNSLEFIELFNSRGEPQDLSGYRLDGSVDYIFPTGTVIPGGGFLVIARSPADIESVYGITGVLGPFSGNLPNDTGTVRLRNQADGVFLEINYGSSAPWPVTPGMVLAVVHWSSRGLLTEKTIPLAWAASNSVGGSAGKT